MVVTLLLGGLTLREPQLAAALAVVVTIILAARTTVHDWISKAVVAFSLGDRRFAFELLLGLVLMVLAAWAGWFVRSLLA